MILKGIGPEWLGRGRGCMGKVVGSPFPQTEAGGGGGFGLGFPF